MIFQVAIHIPTSSIQNSKKESIYTIWLPLIFDKEEHAFHLSLH